MMPMVPKEYLQSAGTGNPELGRFERGFSVELGSEFDELYVGVAGELSLDFEDTPLKLLNADDATEAQQTAKKVAIKNAFTISTEEDGEGTVLTGAVTGVKSLSATELKLEISQTILSEKGVEPGDRLYLNYSGAANVLEGNNDIDVLSFSQEFDANLSDLANFESGSYQGNEFHLTFTDQNLQAVAQDDRTALMNTIKLYSDAGHTNQIQLTIPGTNGAEATVQNALSFVDVTGKTLKVKINPEALKQNNIHHGDQLWMVYEGDGGLESAVVTDPDNPTTSIKNVDVAKFSQQFTAEFIELKAGQFAGGNVIAEFTENIDTTPANDQTQEQLLTAIKNNLKAYSINDDNSESEIANFILDVSVNNNQLIIDLGDTSSGAFADYANAPIRLEYEDTSTTDDPLKGASGAVMSSFEFSVYADEYYSEVVRTGATTINATLDEGAEIQGNELVLSFDGGSLHAQDILYNDLENEAKNY